MINKYFFFQISISDTSEMINFLKLKKFSLSTKNYYLFMIIFVLLN